MTLFHKSEVQNGTRAASAASGEKPRLKQSHNKEG